MAETDSSPTERFKREFFNITLGVLGIIQGLALNEIADKFFKDNKDVFAIDNLHSMAHFAVCFVLILRVFQTYVSGVLDFEGSQVSFWDVVLIFAVGVIQFWAFDALESGPHSRPYALQCRLGVFLAIGAILYGCVLFRDRSINKKLGKKEEYIKYQVKSQVLNVALASVAATASFVSYLYEPPKWCAAFVSAVVAVIIVVSINISMKRTLRAPSDKP